MWKLVRHNNYFELSLSVWFHINSVRSNPNPPPKHGFQPFEYGNVFAKVGNCGGSYPRGDSPKSVVDIEAAFPRVDVPGVVLL